MAVRVMVGATAASVAQRLVTQAESFHTAVERLTAAADALANQTSWDGATAQQFRAEHQVLASRARILSAALQRVAHAAASVIETIDTEDANGMDGEPQQKSAAVPASASPQYKLAADTTASSDDSGGGWLGDLLGSVRSGAEIVTGGALMALGAGGEATGAVLDASGAGLVPGLALNAGSAVVITGGAGLAAHGVVGLGHHVAAMASESGGGGDSSGPSKPKPGDLQHAQQQYPREAHTLTEHVDVSEDEAKALAEKKGKPNGVFADEQTAQKVTDHALAKNARRIQKWLRSGGRNPLPLEGTFGADNNLGWAAQVDGSITKVGNKYTVILQRQAGAPGGYFVKTAYPG
ncbi:RNase A-like domain-containing protein [Streptomyces sp. 900105755]